MIKEEYWQFFNQVFSDGFDCGFSVGILVGSCLVTILPYLFDSFLTVVKKVKEAVKRKDDD